MREPAFWRQPSGIAATLLAPAATCYAAVAGWRMARPGWRAPVPVLCVGNFTLGGAGKTPAAIAVATLMLAGGRRPFFLTRGYGGSLKGPIRVDAQPSDDVGDEPLLLARIAPTIVARDRPAGAAAAAAAGADLVIMDDGLQNPSLAKDFSIAVVDGRGGIGNGLVFPAGPLRAPLEAQLDRTDAMLVVGAAAAPGTACKRAIDAARRRGLPVFHGDLRPDPIAAAALAGKPVLAFAAIADPGKFFATLEDCGVRDQGAQAASPIIIAIRPTNAPPSLPAADRDRLDLVTTEKDLARMRGDPAAVALAARARALPVTLAFREGEDPGPTLFARARPRSAAQSRVKALEDRLGAHVGFLAFDAPVFQLFERNGRSGHGAAHERARPDHPEIAVQELHLRFACGRRIVVEAIEQREPPCRRPPLRSATREIKIMIPPPLLKRLGVETASRSARRHPFSARQSCRSIPRVNPAGRCGGTAGCARRYCTSAV